MNILKKSIAIVWATLIVLSVNAKENVGTYSVVTNPFGGKGPTDCIPGSSEATLDINNVRALLMNAGDMWWNRGTGNAFYEVPRVDDPTQPKRHALFAGAIWIGGIDQSNQVLVSAETYRQGGTQSYFPGPITDSAGLSTPAAECNEWDKHFKVNKSTILQFIEDYTSGKIASPDDVPEEILLWPGRNNPYLAGSITTLNMNLAPYVEQGGNNIYDPVNDGDYPSILGDQSVWWVMNDVGGDKQLDGSTVDEAIGIEVSTMAFAFKTSDYINDMTFYKNIIKNKGNKKLSETYFGQWVDADLGTYDDDYVGCDVSRGLGICYNGKPVDEGVRGYGENPPAVGVDFFKGPLADAGDGVDNDHDCEVDEEGETITMTKFMYYNNTQSTTNGNPNKKADFYNYLRNLWRDGTYITYDMVNGLDQSAPQASYMFPDDSDLEYGWGFGGNCSTPYTSVDNAKWTEDIAGNEPGDRRFLQSAGPFTLQPGAVNEVTVGVVWFRSGSGGATGSLNGLKIADDQAQVLFARDFENLQGPTAPVVDVVELDQELVLKIVPGKTIGGQGMTTETYVELDKSLQSLGAKDPYYRFEGYLVYQLASQNVSVTEISNPDRARLIAQCDQINGITKLVNTYLDPQIQAFIPELKISGKDEGLFHTLSIKQDVFSGTKIVNWKKYHFMVIPYGYNVDPINDVFSNSGKQYVPGSEGTATGIPHKVDNRNGGTILNSNYGSGVPIIKVNGLGNGGNQLSLSETSENELVSNYELDEPEYKGGNSPIFVKVYDPIHVKEGDFTLKMYSRLLFTDDSIGRLFQVGDTIIADNLYNKDNLPIYEEKNDPEYRSIPGDLPQAPAKAVIREFVEYVDLNYTIEKYNPNVLGDFEIIDTTGSFIVAKVEVVNQNDWGSFVYEYKKMKRSISVDPQTGDTTNYAAFIKYGQLPLTFYSKNDPSISSTTHEFVQNDYWELFDNITGDTVKGSKRISQYNEQILPEYGISIEMSSTVDPQYRVLDNTANGYLSASINYGGTGSPWIADVILDDQENSFFDDWQEPIPSDPDEKSIDPIGVYRSVLNGIFSPYNRIKKYSDGGAAYQTSGGLDMYKLGNIDVVMTNDKSKWSRVPVLQYDKSGTDPRSGLVKSEVQSIDKDGNTVTEKSLYNNQTSLGMGWFPGYAVDLDNGRRLNILFSESLTADSIEGNNLQWNPTKSTNGSRSYIYIMNSTYDEGKGYERLFDSAKAETSNISEYASVLSNIFNECMWAGNIRVSNSSSFLAADPTRVQLRVTKAYRATEKGKVPEYKFSTKGVLPETNVTEVADSALALIRVVPNPYYAYSEYETSQLDNVVKLTNLPKTCYIRIYNANGTLVRSYYKSSDQDYLDWDLLNQRGIPISSGAYFMHIEAPGVGEVVVKWFGVLRPLDLDTF